MRQPCSPDKTWEAIYISELERRLLAQICEHCGATRLIETLEVHHIRALKDLNRYQGREKPSWVKNRKRMSAGNGTLYAFDANGRISCIHRPTVEGGEMLQRKSTKEV